MWLNVTGSSRGIGAATAILAAERGYAVCINYLHNQEAANSIVDSIRQLGGKAIAVAADIASDPSFVTLVKVKAEISGVPTFFSSVIFDLSKSKTYAE